MQAGRDFAQGPPGLHSKRDPPLRQRLGIMEEMDKIGSWTCCTYLLDKLADPPLFQTDVAG